MKKLETPQYFSGKERVFQLVLQNKSVLKEIEKNLISAGAENVQVLEEQLKITAEVLYENFKGLEDRLRDMETVSFKEDPSAMGFINEEDQIGKVFIVIEYSFN